MVCYQDTDVAKATLKLSQKYAKEWHVAIDVVSTFKREEPLAIPEVKRMEDEFHVQIKEQFINSDIPYHAHLLVDIYSSGEQLVKFSEGKDYEFIFIGISKRSKVGKLLFGSTAQYIILNAPFPVITVNGLGR
ncbi:MAG: universal stress protein [Deltaproteobacteria bacterium]|nr:MAG: universal stress protein [Deltaproteobacteria bacterium]